MPVGGMNPEVGTAADNAIDKAMASAGIERIVIGLVIELTKAY